MISKPPKKTPKQKPGLVGLSRCLPVAQVVNKGFDPPTNNAVISEGWVRNFLGRRSGRLLVSLNVEGGRWKKKGGPPTYFIPSLKLTARP